MKPNSNNGITHSRVATLTRKCRAMGIELRYFLSIQEMNLQILSALSTRRPPSVWKDPTISLVRTIASVYGLDADILRSKSDVREVQILQAFTVWALVRWFGIEFDKLKDAFDKDLHRWLYSALLEFENHAKKFGFNYNEYDDQMFKYLTTELPRVMTTLLFPIELISLSSVAGTSVDRSPQIHPV